MATIMTITVSHQTFESMRLVLLLVLVLGVTVGAFTTSSMSSLLSTPSIPTAAGSICSMKQQQLLGRGGMTDYGDSTTEQEATDTDRRSFLTTFSLSLSIPAVIASLLADPTTALAAEDPAATGGEDESFASIAARASSLSREAGEKAITSNMGAADGDTRTAYDFDLPIGGEAISFEQIIRQSADEQTGQRTSAVKAVLVVNMKEDDPIARKDIPELITLAARYGRTGEFAVVMSPSDQGYYEPDTSQLIRLKLASEYGFGINPATVITDKVNLLGKAAHPFWRWLQKNCRTPAGLGRIEGNFEKFLIDGRTGLPLRRYPRRYKPLDITNDIEAILAGRPLPPAGANYLEQWRTASVEAERDTYRFQKGLNYYD
jgi:glutathione peroxidase-family protein